MFRRTRPLADPVTLHLDGAAIAAERGEPIAVSLLAADKLALARSPKLHRPRGPSCLRGGCDGCLARVDGVPNVMTCLRPARGGERIETQNVIGSRRADLLRVSDWFFPQGIDHHHLLAGIPGVSDVMQTFARKLAGLGRLPAKPEGRHEAARLEVDVAIVGGGPAGLAVAKRLVGNGRRVALVDDGVELGGSLQGLGVVTEPFAGATVFSRATAAGVFLGELLVAEDERATVIRARDLVLATGAHDPVIATANNDLPGVFSARALCFLSARGVEPTGPVAILGDGPWADELARRMGERSLLLEPAIVEGIHGTGQARAITVRREGRVEKLKVDAVAFATPPAPSFELAEQAGARVRRMKGQGFAVDAEPSGRAGERLWAIGECTGAPLDLGRFERDAETLVAALLAPG